MFLIAVSIAVGFLFAIIGIIVEAAIILYAGAVYWMLPFAYKWRSTVAALLGVFLFANFVDPLIAPKMAKLTTPSSPYGGVLGTFLMMLGFAWLGICSLAAVKFYDGRRAKAGLPTSGTMLPPFFHDIFPPNVPPSPAPQGGAGGASFVGGDPYAQGSANEDDFSFNADRFDGADDSDDTHDVMWRKAQDPRTPEGERQAAMKQLQKRTAPKRITHRKG